MKGAIKEVKTDDFQPANLLKKGRDPSLTARAHPIFSKLKRLMISWLIADGYVISGCCWS